MKRLFIFTGHYGSGKTEVAINFARKLKKINGGRNVAIIDMDIINPFFRTADSKDLLESEGIRVELPIYANTNVDVPALTANMGALIQNKDFDVVLDIGGDDLGAKAVGFYSEIISKEDYILYFVMNPYRPFTADLESCLEVYDEIEDSAKLKITGLVNNSNYLEQTTSENVANGIKLVKEVSNAKNMPILMHTAFRKTAEDFTKEYGCETPNDFPKDMQIPSLPFAMDAQVLDMDECVKLLWKRGEC